MNNNVEHEKYMNLALEEAQKAYDQNEVPVGCIIVDENKKIIAKGYNKVESNKNPLYHAEIIAINKAVEKKGDWRLNNCSIYITSEPCTMCTGAIIQSRIKNVIYSSKNPKFGNIESLSDINKVKFNHKINIVSGVLEEQSKKMLIDFFENLRKK